MFNPHKWGGYQEIEVPVRWQRRSFGGWQLIHAKTGRVLGWIVRNSEDRRLWDVRVCSTAFRGGSATDNGDVLDRVPSYLYGGDPHNSLVSFTIATYRNRADAAYQIVYRLVKYAAPAVGFGRHPEVDTSRSDRYRQLMEATK